VVGIDQKTGKTLWRTQLEDYHDGFSFTGAFRYYDGIVFAPVSGADQGVRGFISALDASSGKELWRFYNIPAPGEVGGDTWPSPNDPDPQKAMAWTHGGATVWQAPAIDPTLGMMYYSTGNAGPDLGGDVRPGDNLFSASIVALDYKTGQYKWHFQEVHHEIWDFDAPSPVVLFDQTYNGVQRKGLYQPGKTGWIYFLDRTNGQPLVGINEQPVPQEPRQFTAATQPYPVGDRFANDCRDPLPSFPLAGCIFTTFWDIPVLTPFSASAGAEWSPSTYDPQTGYVYVNGQESTSAVAIRQIPYTHGESYLRGAIASTVGTPINNTFTAMDSRTNKIVWQKRTPGGQGYGALSTAGGLVFKGQVDGNLVALNATTGDQLWSFQTGLPISAPPMTWADSAGNEYVTVVVGGNRGGLTTLDGDQVWTFSLNGTVDQVEAPPSIQTAVTLPATGIKLGAPEAAPGQLGDNVLFAGTIDTEDYSFTPQAAQVPVGTTISWQNNGSVEHTATATDSTWDTGAISPGAMVSVAFNTAGTFVYSCTPHPWMIGEVIVQ
jgi:alcohol dehydrogenase (cytochrome c)